MNNENKPKITKSAEIEYPKVKNFLALSIITCMDESLHETQIRSLAIAKNQYANALFYKTIKEQGLFYFNEILCAENEEFNGNLIFNSTIKTWDQYCQETFKQPAKAIDFEIANIKNLVQQIKELLFDINTYDELSKCRMSNNKFISSLKSLDYPFSS